MWLVTWPVCQGVSANVARGLTFYTGMKSDDASRLIFSKAYLAFPVNIISAGGCISQ